MSSHVSALPFVLCSYVRLAKTIHLLVNRYIQCIYGMFGREITIHTVTYGVYIRCIYGIFGREITIHTVTYSVYIR